MPGPGLKERRERWTGNKAEPLTLKTPGGPAWHDPASEGSGKGE